MALAAGLYVYAKVARQAKPAGTDTPGLLKPELARHAGDARDLNPDRPFRDGLAPGQIHSYRIEARKDHFFQVTVDQRGVDVKVTLIEPGGRRLVQVDRPIEDTGPEELMIVTERSGSYTLQVEAASGRRPVGEYEVRVAHIHPASPEDRSRAAAMGLFSNAKASYSKNDFRTAVTIFENALAAWTDFGDLSWQAESLVRLGQANAKLGEWEEAQASYQGAAELFHKAGDIRWEAIALQKLGTTYFSLNDLDQAISCFEKAQALRNAAGDHRGEAVALQSLAHIYQLRDEVQRALDSYSLALELFDRPDYRARAFHNLGVLYLSLGRTEHARDTLQEAERIWSETGERREQAAAINQLGELHRLTGELDLALDYYRRALALRRELGDRRGEVTSLANIGLVLLARDELDHASFFFSAAQEALGDSDWPRLKARVLFNLGSLHLQRNRVVEALAAFNSSLEILRGIEAPIGEAEALAGLGRTERRRGNLVAALEHSEAALGVFESVRPRAVSLELRASFFATVQDHFDFHIDLLMELDGLDPEADYDARALAASERARARSLLDLLVESGAKIRQDADPGLLERERILQVKLNARERERYRTRWSPQSTESKTTDLDRGMDSTLRELEEVRGMIRAQHPRYAALTQPLVLSELQRQILDDETLLLEYRLGVERSFLWVLASDSLTSFTLPGRDEMESLALKTYELLLRSHRRETRAATRRTLCTLGRMLIGPAAGQIANKRLLVVADGALQFIPFVALVLSNGSDEDCQSARPLVSDHEITYLSSGSALAILRDSLDRRPTAERSVAVIADPVFSYDDPRVGVDSRGGRLTGEHSSEVSARTRPFSTEAGISHEDVDLRSFERLPFSRREADFILALPTGGAKFSALSFDANKDKLTQGVLSDYQIVHFATHGVLNTKYPELSGIVLSLYDRQGRPQSGFLRAHEVYNLELSSELVVLSACSTALGKEVRGEGLLSLTRGFMYAGAERVMVSLWNVNDQSTAELMARFYRSLLVQKMRPAASLRAAQKSMLNEERYAAPYYWAGFVIQGEWR